MGIGGCGRKSSGSRVVVEGESGWERKIEMAVVVL
jgi:hypothetical protein